MLATLLTHGYFGRILYRIDPERPIIKLNQLSCESESPDAIKHFLDISLLLKSKIESLSLLDCSPSG